MADVDELLQRAWSARRESLSASGSEQEALINDARKDLEDAVAMCRESDSLPQLAQAIHLLANVECDRGRDSVAEALWEEAVTICRTVGEPLQLAHKVRHLGDLHRHHGRHAKAETCYEEALTLYRNQDDPSKLDFANAASNYARLKEATDSSSEALALWREARDLYAAIDLTAGVDDCSKKIERLST